MITVAEAKKKVIENTSKKPTINLPITEAQNHYLATPVFAPVSIPLFTQSAMDGYAFKFKDINKTLSVVGEISAGDTKAIEIKNGEALRIFTGAKVPKSCDTVVMQELTELASKKLTINDKGLKQEGNIRIKGNQIIKGEIALEKGTIINAGAVGFLATLGITNIDVHQPPLVTIIATGNELIKPGNKILEGQVYESNTFMLKAALLKIGITPQIVVIKDNKEATESAIKKALQNSDIVLLSGGISVGDYDFVKGALDKNQVSEIFYKVKQKPGKPLYFGKTKKCIVFALPGNPAAALNCFYEYVFTAINIMKGNPSPELVKTTLPLNKTYTKKGGRANFLKATTDYNTVKILEGQSSDALQTFALANCLVYIPEEKTITETGELVEIHLLPIG